MWNISQLWETASCYGTCTPIVFLFYFFLIIINLNVWMWYTAVCFIYVCCFSPQGKIDMLEKKVIPEDSQLAVDYETVSNVVPPAKKATSAHTVCSLSVIAWFFFFYWHNHCFCGFWSLYGQMSEKMAIFDPKIIFFLICILSLSWNWQNTKVQLHSFSTKIILYFYLKLNPV